MSRTFTVERTVYTFDELSDSAKETAREEWSRFLWDDGSMHESMTMLFDGFMEDRGWQDAELRTYSLYSQGGYPTFRGVLPAFEHNGRAWILTVTTRHMGGGSEYMVCDVEPADDSEPVTQEEQASAESAADDLVHSLSADLYSAFVAEDEYQSSEESVADMAEANGYEYDEDGHLA